MLRNRWIYIVCTLVCVLAGALLINRAAVYTHVTVVRCASLESSSHVLDCVDQEMRRLVAHDAIVLALSELDHLEKRVPAVSAECHRYAHRVGDYWYRQVAMVQHKDPALFELPTQTSVCDFGFLHGYIERIIQDAPNADRILEVCEHLVRSTAPGLRSIERDCFHQSGAGLMLSVADSIPRGDISDMTVQPIQTCTDLSGDAARTECLEGTFDVVVDWTFSRLYGLAPSYEQPFELCRGIRGSAGSACARSVARALPRFGIQGKAAVAKVLRDITDPHIRASVAKYVPASSVQW